MKKIFFMISIVLMVSQAHARGPTESRTLVCAFHGYVYLMTLVPYDHGALCPLAPQSLIDYIESLGVENPPKDDDVHNEECYSRWYR